MCPYCLSPCIWRNCPLGRSGLAAHPLMAELLFEIRSANCSAHERGGGMPRLHPPPQPRRQPARRAELRESSYSGPQAQPQLPLLPRPLPSLTSSAFTEAGSFSSALASSTERVTLGAWGKRLPCRCSHPHCQENVGSPEWLLPLPRHPGRRQRPCSPLPSFPASGWSGSGEAWPALLLDPTGWPCSRKPSHQPG